MTQEQEPQSTTMSKLGSLSSTIASFLDRSIEANTVSPNCADQDDKDSDNDSITEELERIGLVKLPSFSILPHLRELTKDSSNLVSRKLSELSKLKPELPDSSIYSNYFNLPEFNTKMLNDKREEWTNLYMELSDTLTRVVHSNINYPVEDLITAQESEREIEQAVGSVTSTEPMGVEKLKQKDVKLLLTEDRLSSYDHLTYLTFEHFNDEKFLRKRIKEILMLDLSPLDQRFLIQKLMSRSYLEKQRYKKEQEKEPASDSEAESVSDSDDDDYDDDQVILTSKDKEPTYYNIEENILGCSHYQRNCKIECSTCKKWFTCRFCHDQEIQTHQLQRNQTKHILCMFCNTPQYPGNFCMNCDEKLSEYFCEKCILYDNDLNKNIYHCDDCGICRLGLGLNQDYFHCDNCNACISIELQRNHKCIENSTHSNCPICHEYMFNSKKIVVFMSCGHPIHQSCYDAFTKHSYKCPICSRTIVNMELQFRVLDNEINDTVMPDEVRDWAAIVKCVDCGGKSRVNYHYLGLRCDHCNSYNTMQLKIIKGDDGKDTTLTEKGDAPHTTESEPTNHAEDVKGFKKIENSLEQNFQFDEKQNEEEGGEKATHNHHHHNQDTKDVDMNKYGYDDSVDSDDDDLADVFVNNFIRVINNFEKYPSIGEAFKDWLSGTNILMGDNEHENAHKEEKNEGQEVVVDVTTDIDRNV